MAHVLNIAHFSVMTITSVGYGDVLVMPFNETEQVICSIIMLGSGMMWPPLVPSGLQPTSPHCAAVSRGALAAKRLHEQV